MPWPGIEPATYESCRDVRAGRLILKAQTNKTFKEKRQK